VFKVLYERNNRSYAEVRDASQQNVGAGLLTAGLARFGASKELRASLGE